MINYASIRVKSKKEKKLKSISTLGSKNR